VGGSDFLRAGRIGSPHGLDGSVHVIDPVPRLLRDGATVFVEGVPRDIVRLAGHPGRLIVRLDGCADREGAQALGGRELFVARTEAPPLEPDEWWADELEGCTVSDGQLEVGRVRRLLALPSCEVLEVERPGAGELLVPLIADAVRAVDVAARRIDVDLGFLGERG
jgi:16S rRNA processing protein RimM